MRTFNYWKSFALAIALSACGQPDLGPAGASGSADGGPSAPSSELRVPQLGPLPPLPEWPDNPATANKNELGRAIFFDRRLSGSEHNSCFVCHTLPYLADGLEVSAPDRSFPNTTPRLHRNTPSLLDLVYRPRFRWDGGVTDLYHVLAFPFAEANMNLSEGIPASDPHTIEVPSAQVNLKKRLTEDVPGYVARFEEAFDEDIRVLPPERVWTLTGMALAVFMRRAVSGETPFDRWNAGDDAAMDDSAQRGVALFVGKARCIACHSGPMLTDYAMRNTSTSPPDAEGKRDDEGYYMTTGNEADRGKFITPSLRSTWNTAPYFHHGKAGDVRAVIRHLTSDASRADPLHDPVLDGIEPLEDAEVEDLRAFLRALNGPVDLESLSPPVSFP